MKMIPKRNVKIYIFIYIYIYIYKINKQTKKSNKKEVITVNLFNIEFHPALVLGSFMVDHTISNKKVKILVKYD